MITFPDLVDTGRNVEVRSEQQTTFETGTLSIIATEPQSAQVAIIKNGANVGSSTNVGVLDSISLQVRTSAQFSDTIHVAYKMGNEVGIWSATTARDYAFYPNPARARLSVYDHVADDDAISVVYVPTNNAVHIMPQIGAPAVATTSLEGKVASAELILADRLVCSFHDRRLILLSANGKQVLRTIDVPGKPHSVVQLGPLVLVTLFELDQVIALDSSGNLVHTVPVGKAPAGIFASASSGAVMVCNTGDNTVSKLEIVGGLLQVTRTVTVGDYPLTGVAALGADWVSCSGGNTIYKIDGSGATPVVVGSNPKHIAVSGQKLFVACLGSDAIFVVENGETSYTIPTERCPYSIANVGPNRMAVTCLGSKSVVELDTVSNAIVARSEFGKWPMFVKRYNSQTYVYEMWHMTPDYLHQRDTDPHPFVFDEVYPVIPGKVLETNEFTVVGLNTQIPARVAPVSNTKIIKNGLDVGTFTMVSAGDSIRLSITAPTQHDVEFSARLAMGAQSTTWTCRTRIVDDVIDSISFPTVLNAELLQEYSSEVREITGLDDGVEVLASCVGGRLFINEVEVLSATPVMNGDILQVKMTSAPAYKTMQSAVVDIGSFQEVWTIVTKASAVPSYLQPQSDAGKLIPTLLNFPAWLPADVDTSLNKVHRYDKTTLQKKAEYSLTANPTENGLSDAPRLYAIDPYSGKLIVVDYSDPTSPGVERVYTPGGMPYCVAAGPAVAMSHRPTSHYYTVLGSNRIRRIGSSQEILMQAGSKPMGLVVSNYNQMYVADDNGLVHIYEYDEANDTFVLDTIFAIPGGGRLQDFVLDDSTIYVTDITNSCVHILRGGLYYGYVTVGLLPYSITQSGTQVFTANFGTGTISYFRKDENQATSSTLQLPEEASQPLGLAYDAATGRLFVTCSRSGKVYVIRVQDMQITNVITVGPAWGVQVIQGDLYVVTLWGNMLQKRNVGFERANPASLTFSPQLDAELNDTYTKQVKLTEYFVRQEPVYIEPIDGAQLLKNGFPVPSGTMFGTNDMLGISVNSRPDYDKARTIGVLCGQKYTEFLVHTMHDEFPDNIVFPSIQGVIPKDYVYSETRTVSGIEDGLSVKCRAKYSEKDVNAWIEVYLNDVLVEDNEEFWIKNDDTLRINYRTVNLKWNGSTVDVQLLNSRDFSFAVFTAHSGYLDYAIWYPTSVDMMDGMDGREYAPNNAWLADAPESIYGFSDDKEVADTVESVVVQRTLIDGVQLVPSVGNRMSTETGTVPEWAATSMLHLVTVSEETVAYTSHSSHNIAEAPEVTFVQKLPRESVNYTFDGTEVQSNKPWAIKEVLASEWESRARSVVGAEGAEYEQRDRSEVSVYDTMLRWIECVRPWALYSWASYEINTEAMVTLFASEYVDNTDRSQKFVREKEYVNHSGNILFFNASYTDRPRIHSPWFSASYTDRRRAREIKRNAAYQGTFRDKPKASYSASYTGHSFLGTYTAQNAGWLRKLARSHHTGSVAQYSGRLRVGLRAADRPSSLIRTRSTQKTSTSKGYSVPETVVFDEFIYTPTQIRAYPTPAEAYAAGIASLHPVVFTKELWDSTWMWDVPAEIERVDCGNTAMLQRYLRGYVQGG